MKNITISLGFYLVALTLATIAVLAPSRAAMTHWLAPFPPNPIKNLLPWMVSPALGSRGTKLQNGQNKNSSIKRLRVVLQEEVNVAKPTSQDLSCKNRQPRHQTLLRLPPFWRKAVMWLWGEVGKERKEPKGSRNRKLTSSREKSGTNRKW